VVSRAAAWEITREQVAARLLPRWWALLDVACADGMLVAQVAERFAQVVARDVSPLAIRARRASALRGTPPHTARAIEFQVVDATQPLP
jgi:2-polyprenyl-3-methyl-5-hydroxy-6-metoxy-1,4-benzoquinol methylase